MRTGAKQCLKAWERALLMIDMGLQTAMLKNLQHLSRWDPAFFKWKQEWKQGCLHAYCIIWKDGSSLYSWGNKGAYRRIANLQCVKSWELVLFMRKQGRLLAYYLRKMLTYGWRKSWFMAAEIDEIHIMIRFSIWYVPIWHQSQAALSWTCIHTDF